MSMPSNEDPLDRPSRAKGLSLAKGSCGRTYGQIGIGDHGNEGLMDLDLPLPACSSSLVRLLSTFPAHHTSNTFPRLPVSVADGTETQNHACAKDLLARHRPASVLIPGFTLLGITTVGSRRAQHRTRPPADVRGGPSPSKAARALLLHVHASSQPPSTRRIRRRRGDAEPIPHPSLPLPPTPFHALTARVVLRRRYSRGFAEAIEEEAAPQSLLFYALRLIRQGVARRSRPECGMKISPSRQPGPRGSSALAPPPPPSPPSYPGKTGFTSELDFQKEGRILYRGLSSGQQDRETKNMERIGVAGETPIESLPVLV
ncbi:hypothetical protein B0H13DRAFT_1863838 [Mycena leptocephala]|nr:hypothetical protein B0H13DRAFT_1863838 [Mycena leptocephala]